MASIIAEIEDSESTYKDSEPPSCWIPLVTWIIADCDRKITLEIDLDSYEHRRNSLKKIDRMISTLEKFREGVKIEAERQAARERRGR